jgi:hypothetical protein
MFFRSLASAIALVALIGTASCSKPVDVKASFDVTDVSTGWFDAGIVGGKNKLVPSVTFRLRKKADVNLRSVSLNVAFRKVPLPGTNTEEEWDEVFIQNVQFSGPQTDALVVRTETGYTGDPPQTRVDMLKHSQFRDMRVHIFAKHSASQWVELAAIDIERQLLTR